MRQMKILIRHQNKLCTPSKLFDLVGKDYFLWHEDCFVVNYEQYENIIDVVIPRLLEEYEEVFLYDPHSKVYAVHTKKGII